MTLSNGPVRADRPRALDAAGRMLVMLALAVNFALWALLLWWLA